VLLFPLLHCHIATININFKNICCIATIATATAANAATRLLPLVHWYSTATAGVVALLLLPQQLLLLRCVVNFIKINFNSCELADTFYYKQNAVFLLLTRASPIFSIAPCDMNIEQTSTSILFLSTSTCILRITANIKVLHIEEVCCSKHSQDNNSQDIRQKAHLRHFFDAGWPCQPADMRAILPHWR
jgi:hypothetical protein